MLDSIATRTPRFHFTNQNTQLKLCFPVLSTITHTFNHHLLFKPDTTNYTTTKPNQSKPNSVSVSLSLSLCACVPKMMMRMMTLDLEAEAQTRDCFHGKLLLILDIVLASINGILATIAFSQVSFSFAHPILIFNLSVLFVCWLC